MKKTFAILALFCAVATLTITTACKKVVEIPKYNITVTTDEGCRAIATVDGIEITEAVAGTQITLTATVNDGYEFTGWTTSSQGVEFAEAGEATTTFTMPEGNVVIEAKIGKLYNIAVIADENGSATATIDGVAVTQAVAGAQITLTAAANDGYEFTGWTTSSQGVEFAEAGETTTTFTMPEGDITIRAEFAKIKYRIAILLDGGGSATATLAGAEVSQAIEGTKIAITFVPDGSYEFVKWITFSPNVVFDNEKALTTSFTMPEGEVFINVEVIRYSGSTGTLTWSLTSHGTFTINGSGKMPDYSTSTLPPWYHRFFDTVVIEPGVTSIGTSAFQNCSSLASITIPNGLTSIGDAAFAFCSSITNITIPGSVTSIGNNAFYDCDAFTSIIIPNGVKSIGRESFAICDALKSISIPNSVTSIGSYAFRGCASLKSIIIPNGVASIQSGTFLHCTALTSVTVMRTTPPSLADSNFNATGDTLYVPKGCVNTYKANTAWNSAFTNIVEQ